MKVSATLLCGLQLVVIPEGNKTIRDIVLLSLRPETAATIFSSLHVVVSLPSPYLHFMLS